MQHLFGTCWEIDLQCGDFGIPDLQVLLADRPSDVLLLTSRSHPSNGSQSAYLEPVRVPGGS